MFISTRELSKLAGKIVSTKLIIGNIIHLKTRFIYRKIKNRSSWDNTFNLSHQREALNKLYFGKTTLTRE